MKLENQHNKRGTRLSNMEYSSYSDVGYRLPDKISWKDLYPSITKNVKASALTGIRVINLPPGYAFRYDGPVATIVETEPRLPSSSWNMSELLTGKNIAIGTLGVCGSIVIGTMLGYLVGHAM